MVCSDASFVPRTRDLWLLPLTTVLAEGNLEEQAFGFVTTSFLLFTSDFINSSICLHYPLPFV